jgi:plastocyanin
MRHLALLAAVYALVAALVLPGSLLAQEGSEPAGEAGQAPAEAAPAEPAPAEPAPAESAPAAPAAPAEPAPAQPAPAAEPAPAAPAPAQAAPEPRLLADERDEAAPGARAAQSGSVTIVDFSFSPGTITIDQGDTVTWVNDGPTPHSATASDGSFDTGVFPAGQSRSHTFAQAGTFAYICTPHPNMRGTVVVRASQTGGDTPDSSDGDGAGGTTGGTAGAETAQADGGPALPNSGADAGALLVLGGLMLLLGVAVHRRSASAQARPAGRIGW